MVHYFSHFMVNSQKYETSELNLKITDDVIIEAVYEEASAEYQQAIIGNFAVYSSVAAGDFFIVNQTLDALVARFPTFDEAVTWIKSQAPTIAIGLAGILLAAYLLSRRGK